MKIRSPLSKQAYLRAMRGEMESHLNFNKERFTGFFLGPCFYVTYHSGFEWDRRYNNPKNAAMGFITDTPEGCEVRFWRFKGMLCPLVFIPALIGVLFFCLFLEDIGTQYDTLIKLGIGLTVVLITAPLEAFFESLTQRSEEGMWTLLSFLKDPENPYANYYNRIY